MKIIFIGEIVLICKDQKSGGVYLAHGEKVLGMPGLQAYKQALKERGRCLQDSAGGLVKTVIKEFRRLGEVTLSSFSDM